MKIVIAGGVAVGAGTAARLRRLNEKAEIILLEKGEYVSFANCGLPYYIAGEIKEREELILNTPESLRARFHIDVRVKNELVSIDRDHKTVTILDHDKGQSYEESYDKLVLAQGAAPIRPPIPGIDFSNVYQLRSVPDVDAIQDKISSDLVKHAVVIGAGFIGIEMVEAFLLRGLKVSLIEKAPQIMPPADPEMTIPVIKALEKAGVELILNDGIQSLQGDGVAQRVVLESGNEVAGDMFLLGLGVRPDSVIAKQSGLDLGVAGSIKVNEYLQSSDPDIYAAGDLADSTFQSTGEDTWIPLAGPANKQARVIANHMMGRPGKFAGVLGTSIVRFQDQVLAQTGLTEKSAKRANQPYKVSYTISKHHAGYYPGAKDMIIKLLFTPDEGKIIGAQITGTEGVDKRIDVLATAIYSKLTVTDLMELDLAYAPPFGSAKDPIIMAAMTAQNILDGLVEVVQTEHFDMFAPNVQIVDVRDPDETAKGSMEGAKLIPLPGFREHINELDPNHPVVLYCRSGFRSYVASRILRQHGFQSVYNWAGGYTLWQLWKDWYSKA
jgi:NADPH-dependent 2,4-dienoyl-CoA reductase/sulfur reductase-like enzyme/rhodanese-related sulfurtransferase